MYQEEARPGTGAANLPRRAPPLTHNLFAINSLRVFESSWWIIQARAVVEASVQHDG